MGQKVNPISLRLQKTNREFDNSWYTDHFYKKLVCRDIYLQQYINNFLKLVKFPSARFSVQYSIKNAKIYTFLCYPIQSRIMRSKMFGVNLPKKQSFFDKKRKKIGNSLSFLKKKDKKKMEIQKFIIDSHLWTRIYNPFFVFFKKKNQIENNFFLSKKDVQLQTVLNLSKIYNNIVFEKYKLSSFSMKTLILPYFFDFHSFLLPRQKKTTLFFNKDKKIKTKKQEIFFIKNFLITLYLIQFLKKSNRFNKTSRNNYTSLNSEYKKKIFKFFLVFYLLYNQYNQNVVLKKKEKLLNQFSNFSFFQSNSIFYTILENKTPIALPDLLQNSFLQTNQSSLKLKTSQFLNINKNEKAPFFDIIEEKNKTILGQLKHKNYIHHFLSSQFQINTEYVPFGISHDWQSAGFLADEIVYFLERRVPFRRLKNKILKKLVENANVGKIKGIRISCSGRVGGKSKKAQRAKMECVKYGQTSRHTFSSRIDFATRTARTIFGSVGIKVWICYQ